MKWHHVVLTRQAQLESGNQGAAGAQPVKEWSPQQRQLLSWRRWDHVQGSWSCKGTPRTRLCSDPQRGASVTTSSPLHSDPLLDCFSSHVFPFYSRSPMTLEVVPWDLLVPCHSDQSLYRLALKRQASPGSAAGRRLETLHIFNQVQSTMLLPPRMQTRSSRHRLPGKLVSTGMRSVW